MKVLKIVLISLLSLIIAVGLAYLILKYLVWPTHNMQELIPGEPMAYIAAKNLSETLPAAENSDFVSRIAKSPLLVKIKYSETWRQIKLQKTVWEKQTEARINPEGILQLVGKDALLALYKEQDRWGFLLISQVGLITRINIMSGSTERMMESMHEFTKEKYRGVQLMTVKGKGWEFSYGMIGRTGILSLDKSLLKGVVDAHREKGKGFAAMPGFKRLFADVPGTPDVSLYANTAKIRDVVNLTALTSLIGGTESDPLSDYLESLAQRTDTWTGVGAHKGGNLRFDARMSRAAGEKSAGHDSAKLGLAVPDNCLFLALHETLKPDFLATAMKMIANLDLKIISDSLIPALDGGAALAVIKPSSEEFQLLPPAMVVLRIKNKAMAEAALTALENSMETASANLKFTDIEHEKIRISYAKISMIMGISIEAGYAIVGDDLLVLATDIEALKAAVEVFSGKRKSLMESKNYAGVVKPIAKASDARIFVDVGSAVPVIKQASTLYALRARIAGDARAEKIAMTLQQNVFILEAWKYMGANLYSNGGKIDMKLMLSE